MMKFRICFVSILMLLVAFSGSGQNTSSYGKFNNKFYSINDFGSAAQIWTGTQGSEGMVYFGNDDEILGFNGLEWNKIVCNKYHSGDEKAEAIQKTKVCKLYTARDGTTYVGREDNFGLIEYSDSGQIVYNPLYYSKEESSIGLIWNIFETGNNAIIFVAKNKIFRYHNKHIKQINLPIDLKKYTCNNGGNIGDGIIMIYSKDDDVSEKKCLFYDFNTNSLQELSLPEDIGAINIRGTAKINNTWYVFDNTSEVYKVRYADGKLKWTKDETLFSTNLKGKKINDVEHHNHLIYIATESDNLIILTEKGKLFRVLDQNDGLVNKNVFDLFHDSENNLWLNLDNGIHFFETSSPLTFFDKDDGINDRVEKFDFQNGVDYLSTSVDLYETYNMDHHKKIRNSGILGEQVFDINTYETSEGKKTIVVGYTGIYEINLKTKTRNMIAEVYAWKTYQNPLNKNEVFIGLESSLGKITLTKSGWQFETVLADVKGNIRNLTSIGNKLIFGAENKGVYVYDLTNGKNYMVGEHKKNSPNTSYWVEKFQNRIYIGRETGLYYLDKRLKKMLPFTEINKKFISDEKLQIHRIFNDDDKKLWLVTYRDIDVSQGKFEIETGWLETKNSWTWTSWPVVGIELNNGGIVYEIKKAPDNNVWLGANSGVYILNSNSVNQVRRNFTITIDQILINNKVALFNPKFAKKLEDLEYKNNSIRFNFHANSFMGLKFMKYRYKLDGYIDEWTEWSGENYANFQKMFEGNYTIHIQAKNCYGFTSETLKYNFTILPPWYRTWWAYTIYIITFFILIYITIQLSIKRVKNQNIRLEAIVVERTSEIADQNKKLEEQKEEITQKTKDIVDSIVYAKRIQETILPTERLKDMFKEHFVFYRPKDIVSGDFYWARQKGNIAIFSAVDCTGHGVPGALVSIVGNSALLRCVNEHRLIEPAEIMDRLRDIVVKSFVSKGQSDVKDGMDMSLCTLDFDTLTLKYAGANNECVIVRNGEMIELRPDKQPIGQFSHAKPFTQQEIKLQKGDSVYQFTDGYVDQFGGDKGKKLKSRPFKEMLLEIGHLPMNEQYERVRDCFDTWKGDYDQVDDVCVFGIKI